MTKIEIIFIVCKGHVQPLSLPHLTGALLVTLSSFPPLLILAVLVTKSCPTLCDLRDCSLPGFSVLGLLQARILEWVAISSSRGSSSFRNRIQVSCIGRRIL